MQRIRDWFAKKNDSAKVVPPQDVEDVLQDYEEALLKLASLVHPCDEPYLALQACGGSADAEDLQNKFSVYMSCAKHQEEFNKCITGPTPGECLVHLVSLYDCAHGTLNKKE